MSNFDEYFVRRASWGAEQQRLRAVRSAVFVVEQNVPETLEWDEFDALSVHVLAAGNTGIAIGTGRLLPDGHIGRMAVLKNWRGRGVGAAIMRELLAAAHEAGHARLELSAQTHAIGFYRKFGFEALGEEYLEVGIPHRRMECAFTPRLRSLPA